MYDVGDLGRSSRSGGLHLLFSSVCSDSCIAAASPSSFDRLYLHQSPSNPEQASLPKNMPGCPTERGGSAKLLLIAYSLQVLRMFPDRTF